MHSSLLTPDVPLAGSLALIAAVAMAPAFQFLSAGKDELRRLLTLLRASDPATRVQALERARALAPNSRAALGKMLRSDLAASARAGSIPAQQAITVWFIRQVVAMLADARANVRSDAARVLGAMMGAGVGKLAADSGGAVALAPSVAAAIELAGGRALARGDQMAGEMRVLALAEMLEAGLRPLAVGLRALQGVDDEALSQVSAALRDRSPRVRQSLVDVLAAMGGEKAISLLLPLLQDPNADLRAQALRALGNLRADAAASQMAQLLRDPAGEVRAAAATALVGVEARALCGALLDALGEESRREDFSEDARAAIIEAVVKLSDGGLPALPGALTTLPRPMARRLASALEGAGIVEAWLDRADWKGQEDLLSSLLASVAEMGVSRALLDALDSTAERVRLQAAIALGHSRETAALTATANLLGDPNPAVRTEAVKSIARHRDPLAMHALAGAATDPGPAVRLAAVTGIRDALSQRETWRAESLPLDFDLPAALAGSQRVLLNAARDSDPEVRAVSADGLGSFGSLEVAGVLVDLALQDQQPAVRQSAAGALARCPFPQKHRLLAGALEDKAPTRRARAVSILGETAGAEASREVVEALHDPSDEVRAAALGALAGVDPAQVVGELLGQLKNPDPQVRAGVAQLLGRARTGLAIDALVGALSDPEEDVRVNALESLGGMGRAARRHQSALAARRSDPSPRVRDAAGAALSQLRSSWSEAAEAADLFRHGPLSPAAAAAVIDMAAAGDLDMLLRAAGNHQSDQTIASHLAGPGRDKLPALLAALRKAPEQDQARVASSLAGALRQGVPADAFLSQLKALDAEVRLMAVEVVGRIGAPSTVDAVIEVLHRDPVADVRSRAASALAETPVQAAEEALRQALREDPNNVVRRVAGRALDRGHEPPAEGSTIFTEPADATSPGATAEPGAAG